LALRIAVTISTDYTVKYEFMKSKNSNNIFDEIM